MRLREIFPKHRAFEESHWPTRSLFHHGPLERLGRLASARQLATPEAFFETAARVGIPLFVERQGERSRDALVAPTDPDRLARGTTYTLAAAERVVPAIAELVARLGEELALPAVTPTCHVYLSTKGARVRPHFDRQENLAIHIWGKKRWQIAENETIAFPFEDHALGTPPPRALQALAREWPTAMPASARSIPMRPGTALFLPRGMWHTTETLTTSLSITIIFPLANWAEALTGKLLQRLLLDPKFREPAWCSPDALADAFAAAARAVCDDAGGRVVVVDEVRPRLRGRRLETETLSIALDARYVPLVRWMLAARSVRMAEAPGWLSPSETSGVVSFLESHGVLRRA
jgi:50S ribosomal protein L16 3-hydroxylase